MRLTTHYTDLDTGKTGKGEVFLPGEKMHTKVGAGMLDITPSKEVKDLLEKILRGNKINN